MVFHIYLGLTTGYCLNTLELNTVTYREIKKKIKRVYLKAFLFKLTLILSPLILEIMFFNDQEYLICYSLPCTCM